MDASCPVHNELVSTQQIRYIAHGHMVSTPTAHAHFYIEDKTLRLFNTSTVMK